MDILVEIFLEIYMDLMLLIVPERKRQKRHYILATVVAIFVTFGLLSLGVWGVYLLWEKQELLGILPLAVAIVLSVLQIATGIVLYNKKNKK